VTHLEHDELGRLIESSAGTMPGQEEIQRFAYDARGQLSMAATDGVEIHFERDALGQIAREERRRTVDSHIETQHVTSRYDKSGLRTERETTHGHRARYGWDDAGQLASVSAGYGGVLDSPAFRGLRLPQLQKPDWSLEIVRDSAGEEIARRMPGGVVATWKRDAQGRPTERRVFTGVHPGRSQGRDVMHTQYAWRSPDQIGALVDAMHGTRTSYDYDPRG
jgi:YD repeat-containing protein